MGACDIGWTGAMGLIHGGTPWGHATLAGSGQWDRFMGVRDPDWIGAMVLIDGSSRHWLDRRNGIDLWGHVMGVRDWIREMGLIWGHAMGVWHWLDVGDGIELWGHAMGACDWIGVMELICGGEPWGRMTLTRSRRWDWFMWACNGGTRYWLDRGDGVDSWGRAKWQNNMVAEFKWRRHVSSCLALR